MHNTQPWLWQVNDKSAHLFTDWTRHVPTTAPHGRDLLISCGAAPHHFRITMAALGWITTVHRLPNPATPGWPASRSSSRSPHRCGNQDNHSHSPSSSD